LAPLPTIAVTVVAFVRTKDAASVSPKLTEEVPAKLVPIIVIDVPVEPSMGLKDVIVGIVVAGVTGGSSVLLHCSKTATTNNKHINLFLISKFNLFYPLAMSDTFFSSNTIVKTAPLSL